VFVIQREGVAITRSRFFCFSSHTQLSGFAVNLPKAQDALFFGNGFGVGVIFRVYLRRTSFQKRDDSEKN